MPKREDCEEGKRGSDFRSICISVGKPCQIEDPRLAKEKIVSACRDYVN